MLWNCSWLAVSKKSTKMRPVRYCPPWPCAYTGSGCIWTAAVAVYDKSMSIYDKSLHNFGLAHGAVPLADDLHVVISIVFLLVQLTGFGSVLGHWLLAIEGPSPGEGTLVTVIPGTRPSVCSGPKEGLREVVPTC